MKNSILLSSKDQTKKRIRIHGLFEDDDCKELYKLIVLVNPSIPKTEIQKLESLLEDFQYEHIQDGWLRYVMRGQMVTLYNKWRELDA